MLQRTEGPYSCSCAPRIPLIELIVGTRPESVVKRRINPPRPSWEFAGWDALFVVRGGETSPKKEVSLRGEVCVRKRNSSILSLALLE
jgi:hypothetical protein